ncbi:MAG TPA: UDP-N-acetylmuramoyl-tripeptide--D-alanyl-D-alanine ligase, partial [Polyangiaceae bacterium]|nr:UDP-N-acetylmuramoyl-tripeptide--D-alanyl-D-alanine ligase [Polyangiaceae bacterium]
MATPLPPNRAPFTLDEVLSATGGAVVAGGDCRVEGVGTDSRALAPGQAFVALRGERFDGHEHVARAAAAGARLALIDREVAAPPGLTLVRVPDTLRALGALALAHRLRWAAAPSAGPRRAVVAVAGSVGKTTTRRAVATALAALGRAVHASAGNLNNAVGIPIVLLGLGPEHDAAVVEVGTSSPGEVAYGASLARPDVAVLTRVAVEHAEGLGGLDDIAREEGAIFEALGPEGVAIANADDEHCAAQLARVAAPRRRVAYGRAAGADVRLLGREPRGLVGSRLRASLPSAAGDPPAEHAFHTPLLGDAGAYATCAALAVAHALAPDALAGASLERAFAPLARDREPGRLAPIALGDGTVVLDDTYNANLASVAAGLDAARELAAELGRRLVVVLGEMRELGPLAAAEHDEAARLAAAAAP